MKKKYMDFMSKKWFVPKELKDPEYIKEETGLSKAAFKRAVGRLLKEGKIVITKDSIVRK